MIPTCTMLYVPVNCRWLNNFMSQKFRQNRFGVIRCVPLYPGRGIGMGLVTSKPQLLSVSWTLDLGGLSWFYAPSQHSG